MMTTARPTKADARALSKRAVQYGYLQIGYATFAAECPRCHARVVAERQAFGKTPVATLRAAIEHHYLMGDCDFEIEGLL